MHIGRVLAGDMPHVGDSKQCEQVSPSLPGEPTNFPFFKQLIGQLNLVPYGTMGHEHQHSKNFLGGVYPHIPLPVMCLHMH